MSHKQPLLLRRPVLILLMVPVMHVILTCIGSMLWADSAGTYNGPGAPRTTVSTRILTTTGQLQAQISANGFASLWQDVRPNPSGDGKDILNSVNFVVDGQTYRWKNGKLQRYDRGAGGWKTMKKPKPKKKQNSSASSSIVQVGDETVSLPDN